MKRLMIPFCIALLACACVSAGAYETIVQVQKSMTYRAYPLNPYSFTDPNTAGNTIIACIGGGASTDGSATISDSNENSYVAFSSGAFVGAGQYSIAKCWYAKNIVSGSNAITFSATWTDIGMTMVEYSGINQSDPFMVADSSYPPSGNSGTLTPTGNPITTDTKGMIFAYYMNEYNGSPSGPGTNFTGIYMVTNHYDASEEWLNVTPRTTAASFNLSGSGSSWVLLTGAFRAAGEPDPPGPPSVLY